MQANLERETIDSIISLADFGDYVFVCNDGAEYDGEDTANVALYLTPPTDDDNEDEIDSECHDLEVKIVDGKYLVTCEIMTNSEEIEANLNR
ncbi:hypothetical protein OTK49_20815 [Vibrio coralliirubri]|uniref:hypothetical protein n=1 Tax=Vibrio coralliirubri TaxID=1516159 RepID=UPI002284589C|nr:hypothetical protein [Vibrio coralliirubri]MCY9864961.1 hypothetical protein [Vibrio coralliirubri]